MHNVNAKSVELYWNAALLKCCSFCKFDLLSLPFLPFFLKPFLRRLPVKRQRLPELHVICTWTGDVIKPLLPVSGHQQGAVALAQCPSTFQVTIESRTSVCPLDLVYLLYFFLLRQAWVYTVYILGPSTTTITRTPIQAQDVCETFELLDLSLKVYRFFIWWASH